MEFENVIRNFNQYKNFSEYDENEWDYLGDDEFYERTQDWRTECKEDSWDFPSSISEWGY